MVICVLVACSLLLTKVALDLISEIKEDKIVRGTFIRMKALSHSINEDVLRSRNFMLQTYDPIVSAAEKLSQTCQELKNLKDWSIMTDPTLRHAVTDYCAAVEKKTSSIESFKSSNSLYKNSIRYMPTLIEQIGDVAIQNRARKIFNDILMYRISSQVAHAKILRDELKEMNQIGGRAFKPSIQHFSQHTEIILDAWQRRKEAEQDVLSSDSEESYNNLVKVYELSAQANKENQRIAYAVWILVCGLLAAGIVVMFKRVQMANATLEEKVLMRTKELREKQQMLVQSTKTTALGEMAGGIAHEINTPLGSIMLNAEMLLELIDQKEQPEVAGVAQSIIKTVGRISKIITGLRRFSRDTGGDTKTPVSISDIVQDTLNFCQEKMRTHAVELNVNTSVDQPIHCVPEQISQVLLNLLNNAYDALSETKEMARKISIDTAVVGDRIQLSVTNSGAPLSEAIQQKLMQPFFTTKPVGKGVGLGLSISKGICEEHGGTLFYDPHSSTPRFVIELPIYLAQKDAA